MPVLIPLTVDRFVAVVFPMHYKTIMKTSNSRLLVAMSWIPLSVLLVYDIVLFSGGAKVCMQS